MDSDGFQDGLPRKEQPLEHLKPSGLNYIQSGGATPPTHTPRPPNPSASLPDGPDCSCSVPESGTAVSMSCQTKRAGAMGQMPCFWSTHAHIY
ncbi:hypothetical protein DPEC_G00047830 [Dallia pectoralis]|uniref:Uncharacterized protein n=1 Tax=Dallia pectoralis TaxID=75939 RepID=A0ACC2HAZ4_DALPE|nr:hypothetical protein DPEC_G00047830 [Dallia pectoralis]